MGPLEEKREEKGDQDGQKRGKETRQEGREDLLTKGSGVVPPIHDQNWSLLARPLGSPGSETPVALPAHRCYFHYVLWKYMRLDFWAIASPLKQ